MKSVQVSQHGPQPARFSVWFPFAAAVAVIAVIAAWRTPYRGIAILLAAAVVIGWILQYAPITTQQIGGTADLIAGVTPTGAKS